MDNKNIGSKLKERRFDIIGLVLSFISISAVFLFIVFCFSFASVVNIYTKTIAILIASIVPIMSISGAIFSIVGFSKNKKILAIAGILLNGLMIYTSILYILGWLE